jgi:glycerol kinase
MTRSLLLAIDQGTTSSRAMLFSPDGVVIATAQQEFQQFFPDDGWVEHDPVEIWTSVLAVTRAALQQADAVSGDIAALGITNQRETTLIWDRKTGEPIHRAIVWQDRRTADLCHRLRGEGAEPMVTEKTGLVLDPYFSGTKIAWLLDNVEGARARAERGELAFGTIDSFLLWRLTGGTVHATDATNASRTLLFNIATQDWDDALLSLLDIPRSLLPVVCDSSHGFGNTQPDLLGGAIAIGGVAGDQQAATVGQACFEAGMAKSTYGTGCFVVANTGSEIVRSSAGLLTTVAYRLAGKTTYALEGSIFVAGAAMQWLRDGLHLFKDAAESEELVKAASDNHHVYMVPAFTGLGAPYWDPHARGALLGMTRDTGIADITRAALDAVCHQTHDLLHAMASDGTRPGVLRVDGGMTRNGWFLQRLADLTGATVERPEVEETTALGAACLAGMQAGVLGGPEDVAKRWSASAHHEPVMDDVTRNGLYEGWQDAVSRIRSNHGINQGEKLS